MKIHARDLAAGDVLNLHDWALHVTCIEIDRGVGVRTAEFDFSIHFFGDDLVEVNIPVATG